MLGRYFFALARTTINSAGFDGATPTKHTRRPDAMSFWVIVSWSQRTKNESSRVWFLNAPNLHIVTKNFSMVRRTTSHNAGPLDSRTTHCSPCWIDCSRKIINRRTFRYFQTESWLVVCAPETAGPCGEAVWRTLIPREVIKLTSAVVKFCEKPVTPKRAEPAGETHTPLSISVRASVPAHYRYPSKRTASPRRSRTRCQSSFDLAMVPPRHDARLAAHTPGQPAWGS